MKSIFKPLCGLFSVALAASALCLFHFTSWGKDTQPAFNLSTTPVNRDARLGTSYAPVVKKVAPSVVNIYSTQFIKERPMRNPFMNDPVFRQIFGNRFPSDERERTRAKQSNGSGVIVTPDGYILTANHVVADADEIKVGVPGNKMVFTAKVIGTDPATDIAVLKIQSDNLPAVTLADSDQVEVGDVVLAIGNPFDVGQTVTMGIVSALGRNLRELSPGQGARYQDFIQTDAAINPGNSGGPLVDVEGRLIGINDVLVNPSGAKTSAGIGLAVPVNLARHVMEGLITSGKVARGYLGIQPQDIDAGLAKQFNLPDQNGVLVADVMPDSPAARAGLKSGDVITAINGKPVTDAHGLQLTISELPPGSQATFKIARNGFNKNIVVTLEELPGATVTIGGQTNPPAAGEVRADALNGVNVADLSPQLRTQLGLADNAQGAIVTDVAADSNSAAAGLQPNDVIVEINFEPVASAADAVRLGRASRGDQILIKIWRRAPDRVGTRFLSVNNSRRAK